MKIWSSIRRKVSGQVLAEACIGLSLMTFTWIMISYSLYMANYSIRTEMAARYAAWYQANDNGTAVTPAQLDQYFFFQSGLSSLTNINPPALIGNVIEGNMPTNAASYSNGDGSQPFMVSVGFGVTTPQTTSPFPFNLFSAGVQVPLMPSNSLSVYQVYSICQWDDDCDVWTNASQAFSGLWNTIESSVSSFM